MFNSSVLDIAIGIIFIFLLLSVFATAINEVILSLLSKRGEYLLKGIAALLNDEDLQKGIVRQIYEHGQVYGLYQGPFDEKKLGNLPSYIPSRNFALAFLDSISALSKTNSVQTNSTPSNPATQQNLTAQPIVSAVQTILPSAAPAVQIGKPVVPAGQRSQAEGQQIIAITAEFKAAADALAANPQTQKIGKPLVSMIAMAGEDATKLQKSIEDWFDSGMDRVSGKYKYHTQFFLLLIGFVLAVAMNADTIHIVRQLSNDSTLRGSILAAASAAAKPASSTPASATPGDSADVSIDKQIKAANDAVKNITDLGLPIGWPAPTTTDAQGNRLERSQRFVNCLTWIFYDQPSMLLGWCLTAIAISLGAPFWFDALNKIMVIRSTIKPTEKSQEEGSKDKPKS